jgi:hypothetical protein
MSRSARSWIYLRKPAKALFVAIGLPGVCVLLYGGTHTSSRNIAEFLCYLLVALLASRLKINMAEIADTMSVNFLFILIGVLQLSFTETLALGCAAILAQSFFGQKARPIQVTFNLCSSAISIALAYAVYNLPVMVMVFSSPPVRLVLASSTYFLVNTGSVATFISLADDKPFKKIWIEYYFWSFPYYLVGAAAAGGIDWLERSFSWETSLLALPVI